MEERIDLVDENGIPSGETVLRSIAHAKGLRHRTAHVWVYRRHNERAEVLLQKRAENKDSYPGCWDTSSAGHIRAGDEPADSALREMEEELGIRAEKKDLCLIGTYHLHYEEVFHDALFKDNEVVFLYLCDGSRIDIDELILQEEEVESAAWFGLDEVIEARRAGDPAFCVPIENLELLKKHLSSGVMRAYAV